MGKYIHLVKIMELYDVTVDDLAKLLKIRPITVCEKLLGLAEFTLDEAFLISKTFFPDYGVYYLFSEEK